MQSACLQLQNYLAVILIDIALHDDFMSSMEKQRLSAEIILCKNNASESNESLFSD